jgi:hypothetical protein
MIVNHRHRFIFLKTKKTAGTSIEIALSQYCDGSDVLSRIGRWDEPIRTRLGYQGPANHLVPPERFTRSDWWRRHLLRRDIVFYNHMPAAEVLRRIGPETWSSYFKFCFERNPWDRAISAYYWENRGRRALPDFHRFLHRLRRAGLISNYPTYSIDGRIAVDRVLLYENLDAELQWLCARLALPGPLILPNAKRQFRKDRRPYQELYSERDRAFVAEACAREIEAFGYRF